MKQNIHRFIVLIVVMLGLKDPLLAQHYNLDWVNSLGNRNDIDEISSIGVDAYGNIYSVGVLLDTLDFDLGGNSAILSSPVYATFITKNDANGSLLWVKKFTGNSYNFGSSIHIDEQNNILISGAFRGTVDFDPGPNVNTLTANFEGAVYIVKLDTGGNYDWARMLDGNSSAGIYSLGSIDNDYSENVYLTGTYLSMNSTDSIDFDPGIGIKKLSTPGYGGFVLKLDKNGQYLWAKTFLPLSSAGGSSAVDIATDHQGNALITGSFSGTVDFGAAGHANETLSGENDIFVLKLSNSGSFVWVKSMGGKGDDIGYSIAVDNQGNVYATGQFGYTGVIETVTSDFDPGINAYNFKTDGASMDCFISKLNNNGGFVWAKRIGSTALDLGLSISVDAQKGIVYTSGMIAAIDSFGAFSVDLNPGAGQFKVTSSILGSRHQFISLLDTSGDFLWGGIYGPPTSLSINYYTKSSIAYDKEGAIYLGGHYTTQSMLPATIDFDPGPGMLKVNYVGGSGDGRGVGYDNFLLKLSPCHLLDSKTTTACDSFLFRNQVYKQSGTYFDTSKSSITGVCDSIFKLDLTLLGHTAIDTLLVSKCDSFNYNGKWYKNSGYYAHKFATNTTCDSNVILSLTISGQTPDTAVLVSGSTLTSLAAAQSYQWLNCNNGYAIIAGANSQNFIPELDGDYAVLVTGSGGCSDTSGCYRAIGSNRVNELRNGNAVTIFPNPVTNQLNATTVLPLENATVTLYNVMGQIIGQQYHLKGEVFTLEIGSLPPSIYTLEITEGERKVRIKVVKK